MEINIPVSGVPQFNATPVVRSASTDSTPAPQPAAQVQFSQVAVSTSTPTTTADNSAESSPPTPQTQAAQATLQAALSFKNVYAVSDKEFTIFKDATGAYITRYVSLRDGTVTYEPTPQYVKPQEPATSGSQVSINA